jgi:hypothetical protein
MPSMCDCQARDVDVGRAGAEQLVAHLLPRERGARGGVVAQVRRHAPVA